MSRSATPHDLLWDQIRSTFPGRAFRECPACIEGHYYRIDVAIPSSSLAIEMDGWEWHGKHLGDFTRDRTRQNLLTCAGWRVLRYTAKQIRQSMSDVMAEIVDACADQAAPAAGAPGQALHGLQRVAAMADRTLEAVAADLGCHGRQARIFLDCVEGMSR